MHLLCASLYSIQVYKERFPLDLYLEMCGTTIYIVFLFPTLFELLSFFGLSLIYKTAEHMHKENDDTLRYVATQTLE